MIKKILKGIVTVIILVITGILLVNFLVILKSNEQIQTIDELKEISENESLDCIIILGAAVWHGDEPSPMLQDRLDQGIELYKAGVCKKLLMSGDHGTKYYNEVNVMKQYAINKGVPSEDIYMDHAGFSTYDSMYRAKNIFGVKKAIVVTQSYHLYRSIYIGTQLGMTVYGSGSDLHTYPGQLERSTREILARDKDYIKVIQQPEATYMGKKISLEQNGDMTNSQKSIEEQEQEKE